MARKSNTAPIETAAEAYARLDAAKVELQRTAIAASANYNQMLALWDGHCLDALHQRPDWVEVLDAREAADAARLALAQLGDDRAAALAAMNGGS